VEQAQLVVLSKMVMQVLILFFLQLHLLAVVEVQVGKAQVLMAVQVVVAQEHHLPQEVELLIKVMAVVVEIMAQVISKLTAVAVAVQTQ
jgi:hypothetical protein